MLVCVQNSLRMKYVLPLLIVALPLGLTSCNIVDGVSTAVVGVPLTRRAQPLMRQTNEYDVMIQDSKERIMTRKRFNGEVVR